MTPISIIFPSCYYHFSLFLNLPLYSRIRISVWREMWLQRLVSRSQRCYILPSFQLCMELAARWVPQMQPHLFTSQIHPTKLRKRLRYICNSWSGKLNSYAVSEEAYTCIILERKEIRMQPHLFTSQTPPIKSRKRLRYVSLLVR